MSIWRLISREIMHQRLNFILGVASVTVAAAVLVAALTLLNSHDRRTEALLAQKEQATAEQMALLQDDYRKIMKKLGFNLLILPEGQDLARYHASGYVDAYMPEDYVRRLSEAGLMTIRHLLPSIEQRIAWPEHEGLDVILAGTRGEVPVVHLKPKEPMQQAVGEGEIVLGYSVAASLGLENGERTALRGQEFRVSDIHPERGTRDDITVWVSLATAQRMLGREGQINAILALKCLCEGNQISQIRADVSRALPGTQVIEVDSRVVTRAEARERAKTASDKALASEHENRAAVRSEIEVFAAWLVPVVILGAAVWIALLALGNVRQRRGEIGLLRAMGINSSKIMKIFLGKAALIGFTGAVAGYAAGFMVGFLSGELNATLSSAYVLFDPGLAGYIFLGAPLLAVTASWIPALIASLQDPAEILREE